MNRKKLILAILLLILAVAIVSSFFRMPKQEKVPQSTNRPSPGAAKPRPDTRKPAIPAPAKETSAPVKAIPQEGKLRLDLLQGQPSRFTGFRRNIFKPLFITEEHKPMVPVKPATKPPSLIPAPPPPVQQLKGPQVITPPAPPLPPPLPRPTPDLTRFTFMGFLKKDNQRTIFLSKDKEIFVVKKGDKLAGKYEAANITDEALTLRVLQDGGEIVIPLIENKALMPAVK